MQLFNFFQKKEKRFSCGGERCIEFWDKNHCRSKIWYRKPNGDEMLNFAHTTLATEESELRELSSVKLTPHKMQELLRKKKLIPFGVKIITKFEGYEDKDGKVVTSIDNIIEYYPHHIESVVMEAYNMSDKYKKKI